MLAFALAVSMAWACKKPSSDPQQHLALQNATTVRNALKAYHQELKAWNRRQLHAGHGLGFFQLLHGTAYEYFRNDALDAIPHEVHQYGGSRSALHRNQFGIDLVGPIGLHPGPDSPTHFSFSFEGTRESIARPYLATVPTLAERQGDFSDLVDAAGKQIPIYDPATTQPNPNYDPNQPVSFGNPQYLRQQFPGNVIPTARLDPVALALLRYFPLPNTNVGPFLQNNYFSNAVERNTPNGGILHIDHNFSTRHQATLTLKGSIGQHDAPSVLNNPASPDALNQAALSRSLDLNDRWSISDRTTQVFWLSISQDRQSDSAPGEQNWPQQLGVQGVTADVFPNINLGGGYPQLGQQNPNQSTNRVYWQVGDTLSQQRGRHALSLSAQFQQQLLGSYQANYPAGSFQFSGQQTSLPGVVDTGSSLAQFLLGDVSQAQLNLVPQAGHYRASKALVQMQDRYPLLRGMQWTIGVNWKYVTPRQEAQGHQSSFDLSTIDPATGLPGAMIFGHRPGLAGLQPARSVFEPHTGLAYNFGPHRDTIFTAGYQMLDQDFPMYGENFGSLGFTLNPQYVSPNDQLQPALVLANGFPNGPVPPFLSPSVGDNQVVPYIEPSGLLPVQQFWNAGLEEQFGPKLDLRAGYNGQLLTHSYVWNGINLNGLTPADLIYGDQLYNQSFSQSLRPYPQVLNIALGGVYPYGTETYNGGYITLDIRATHGLTLESTYKFGKILNNFGGWFGPQDVTNLSTEKSIAPWDRSRNLNASFYYQLPALQNTDLGSRLPHANLLLGGWSISGFLTLASGQPLIFYPEFNNTGGVAQGLRVNLVPGVDPEVTNPSANGWFNPAAFAQPADFTLGDGPRTSPNLRAPGIWGTDLSLTHDATIEGTTTLETFLEAFNAFNHANLNSPDTMIGSASSPNLHAGKITGSTGGRVIELGLRWAF